MGLLKCEKVKENNYVLEISVGKEAFFEEINKVYKKNVSKINIPGFRKGKAPKAIIEKMYGNNIFWDDAINNLYPEAYIKAAKEAKLDIVATNKLDVVSVDIDNGFVFKVECTVSPEVEIAQEQYKGLEVTKNINLATDKDVEGEIERIRNSYSRTIDVTDRAAELGDIVIIDFDGKLDGKPFEGGKATNYELKLGSGQFIPGFEDQIVGHKIGEEFDINVKFPEDYHSKELAGKDSVFGIVLHEIKNVELPELDDEFVKDISEFDNVEDFKADVKKSIQEYKDKEADREVEDKLVDKLIAAAKIELPQVMVEQKIKNYVKEFEEELRQKNIKFDDYLKYSGQTLQDLEKMFEPKSIRSVKLNLILKKIAQLEDFQVTEQETEENISQMSKIYNVPAEKIKKVFDQEQIIENIKLEKSINLVKEMAKIKEIAPETEKKSAKPKSKKTK